MTSEGPARPRHRGVEVACEHCNARVEILPQSFGGPVKCVECGHWFRADAAAFERAKTTTDHAAELYELGPPGEAPRQPRAAQPPPPEETEREELEERSGPEPYRCPKCEGEMDPDMLHCPYCGASKEGDRELIGYDGDRAGWRQSWVAQAALHHETKRLVATILMAAFLVATLGCLFWATRDYNIYGLFAAAAGGGSAFLFFRVYREDADLWHALAGSAVLWFSLLMVAAALVTLFQYGR